MEEEIIFDEESFYYEVYQVLDPVIKTFLSVYFGKKILHLEPEAYSEIETAIKNKIHYNACIIPDILYNHCTIKNQDEWDKAFDNFKNDKLPIPWHDTKQWFDRDFSFENDDEDTFLEDAFDFELTEIQQKAKKIVEAADLIINNTRIMAHFMRAGYKVLNAATRQFLVDTCIFDLKHLSAKGFIDLQNKMDMMNEMILEDLFAIIQD